MRIISCRSTHLTWIQKKKTFTDKWHVHIKNVSNKLQIDTTYSEGRTHMMRIKVRMWQTDASETESLPTTTTTTTISNSSTKTKRSPGPQLIPPLPVITKAVYGRRAWTDGRTDGRRHPPASRPWFYPVVEQHDVTYHRVKPLTWHRRQTHNAKKPKTETCKKWEECQRGRNKIK